jgi:hypothetical protein
MESMRARSLDSLQKRERRKTTKEYASEELLEKANECRPKQASWSKEDRKPADIIIESHLPPSKIIVALVS